MSEKRRTTPWLWALEMAEKHELDAASAHVLLIFAVRADPENQCWPGATSVAAQSGRSEPTVTRAIRKLREAGLIHRRPRGTGKTWMTTLLIDPDRSPTISQDAQSSSLPDHPRSVSTDHPRSHVSITGEESGPITGDLLTPRGNNQENGGVPNGVPTSRPDADQKGDEGDPLAREIHGSLLRVVAGLHSETKNGHVWPNPKLAEIVTILREQRPGGERARRAVEATRRYVQEKDRAPHIAGLYAKVLAETSERPDPAPDPVPTIAGFVEATRMGRRRPSAPIAPPCPRDDAPAQEVGDA